MILSRRSSSTFWSDIGLLWGGLLVAAFVTDLVRRAPLSPYRDVIISQSFPFLAALCCIVAVTVLLGRLLWDDVWKGMVAIAPAIWLVAAVIASVGPWNDGSGSIALAPADVGLFVITGGILPFGLGPEAVVRLAAILFSITVGILASRRGLATPRALLITIVGWIAACIPLLAQSWIAFASALFRDLPLQHALDASRALGVVLANSYWSNFQADRFFSGIGNQVDIAASFAAAALCVIFVAAMLFAMNARAIVSVMREFIARETLLVLSPVAAGFLIGLRGLRWSWNGIDILSVLLGCLAVGTSIVWSKTRLNRKEIADVSLLLALVSGLLVGWPVLALLVALFVLGRASEMPMRVLRESLSAGLLVAIGGSVAVRSAILPPAIFDMVILWAVLTALLLGFQKKIDSWLRYGFFIGIGAGWILTLIRFAMKG